jgi:hypothetical protein
MLPIKETRHDKQSISLVNEFGNLGQNLNSLQHNEDWTKCQSCMAKPYLDAFPAGMKTSCDSVQRFCKNLQEQYQRKYSNFYCISYCNLIL